MAIEMLFLAAMTAAIAASVMLTTPSAPHVLLLAPMVLLFLPHMLALPGAGEPGVLKGTKAAATLLVKLLRLMVDMRAERTGAESLEPGKVELRVALRALPITCAGWGCVGKHAQCCGQGTVGQAVSNAH
jgi:hypothetical protein